MNQGKKLKKKSVKGNVTEPTKSKVPVNVPVVKASKQKLPELKVEPNAPKSLSVKALPSKVLAPKVLTVKATRKKMNLRGIIDDMMRERPTQNNFEDLYKLEGFDLYRHQYKRDKRL